MLTIESAQNSTYKKLLSLTTSKGLKEEELFLLCGEKLIREFLANPSFEIIYEIKRADQISLAISPDVEVVQLPRDLFDTLDVLGTHFNILALKQPPLRQLTCEDMLIYKPEGIEIVIPMGDPGNLGAMLRSCEAFAAPRVILTREAANPFLPKAVKASAGSVLRLPLTRGPSLLEFPDSSVALDMEGTPVDHFVWPQDALLVVGEEGPGLGASGKKKFATRISIPTQGVESLNAVVAASIVLSRIPRK